MLSKTRTTMITLVAAFSFAGASMVPAVAQAKPPFKSPRPGMKGCSIKLGGNVTLAVDDEGYIEVTGASGKLITLRCKDGKWYEERLGSSTSVIRPELLVNATEVVSPPPTRVTPPSSAGALA
jgi:hypothetical protein